MKKDKEWLKNEVEDYLAIEGVYDARVALEAVLRYIDQLDEPELSVIPQFVANWIETCKGHKHNLFGVYEFAPEVVSDWIFDNESKKERVDLIARAWLDENYTIEKESEKLYRVKFPNVTKHGNEMYLDKNDGEDVTSIDWSSKDFVENEESDDYLFTEQEIKAIDPRYWSFAEEVPNE